MNSLKHSFTYSFAAIIVAVALSLGLFFLGMYESLLNYLSYLVFIAFVVLGIKTYTDKVKGGTLTFGQAMGYGTYMALVYSIFMALWTFVFFKYIAHDEMEQLQNMKMAESLTMMREQYKMSETQIEQSLKWAKTFSSPGVITVFALIINMVLLTIINLIVAAIMKKDPPVNFENPNNTFIENNPYTN